MILFTKENISKIKSIVYTNQPLSKEQRIRIDYSQNEGLLKDFNYDKFKEKPFPKNASMKTYSELIFLKDLSEDVEFVKMHDDIQEVFRKVCNYHNVEYPKKLVDDLMIASHGIILDLKYHYNRARPKQLAKEYGINLGGMELESMKSPSYPSGHSTQGFLVGKMLQTRIPINSDAFLHAAYRISYSRNVAKAHFPSDSQMGEELGTAMYSYLKDRM